MHRRDFLKMTSMALAITSGMPQFLARAAAQARGEKTLVVIQLSGGNDGLNTLIPYGNDAYYAARPNIAIPRKDVLPVTDVLGMNPNLKAFLPILEDNEFAWIESVGYPNPNRSHFASMAIWHTADPTGANREGWIGRIAETIGDPFCATYVGDIAPLALRSDTLTLPVVDDPDTYQVNLPAGLENPYQSMLNLKRTGEAAFIQQSTLNLLKHTQETQQNLKKYRPGAQYPATKFAEQLKDLAKLIASGQAGRILYTSLGGFDTHAAQRAEQDDLLKTLSEGLAAFRADLMSQGLYDQVMVLAFSEFGRRVHENDSAGTDHGKGGVMFTFGKGVKGGIHGSSPDLENLDDGDVRYQVDFRGVYARTLKNWLGLDPRVVLGKDFDGPAFI
ncbi:DUF1501 domain-containing protein [Deinococcus roseus]|uniref:Twin-arginine translocation pathway signal protein n=1 Tax=Deinococcus roseus TaxID=392414 RepID=A0ABQ2CWF4_9DEIO|nr:DUF1501 domain-containing protein [Deinococcus roseus]GGJ20792.1 hypothetical protein GCM10008938_03760 [Deinococcus roseus]